MDLISENYLDHRLENVLFHHNAIRKGLGKKIYEKDKLKKESVFSKEEFSRLPLNFDPINSELFNSLSWILFSKVDYSKYSTTQSQQYMKKIARLLQK